MTMYFLRIVNWWLISDVCIKRTFCSLFLTVSCNEKIHLKKYVFGEIQSSLFSEVRWLYAPWHPACPSDHGFLRWVCSFLQTFPGFAYSFCLKWSPSPPDATSGHPPAKELYAMLRESAGVMGEDQSLAWSTTSVCRIAARCSLAVRDSLSTSICCLLSENWLVRVSSLVCSPRSWVSFLERSCLTWSIYITELFKVCYSYARLIWMCSSKAGWAVPCSSWTWCGCGRPPSAWHPPAVPHS